MPQYLLSIYQPDGPIPPKEFLDPIMARLDVVNADMTEAGVRVFAAGLFPPETATVIRAKDEEVLLTDGPFTEGKEHIGGFTVVNVADLDAALHWGRRLAEAIGLPIEVRPMHE